MERLINWSEKIRKSYPRIRLIVGVVLILAGAIAFITPLTPGSWLVLIGLELIGVRILFWLSKLTRKNSAGTSAL